MTHFAPALTPLWPAGHLPLKGGDQLSFLLPLTFTLAKKEAASMHLISPLEGEMAGRPEGGNSGLKYWQEGFSCHA